MIIMTISSYNVRPRFSMYWLLDEDLGLPLVRRLMSQNKFRKTKTYLYCCDNTNLDETDKWIKLRPLTEALNEKLQQFGIFSSKLSIDEQMVPYFGRHSCKIFIRGKALSFIPFLSTKNCLIASHIFHINHILGPSVYKHCHTFVLIYLQASVK